MQFVAERHARERFDVMYNDFVIVGPSADPAKVAGQKTASAAFAAIAAAQAPFASRGDKSGTHTAELGLWQQAGVTPAGAWYRSLGQGMGETLMVANEQRAYTLSDRGTWLSMREKVPGLALLLGGRSIAENPDPGPPQPLRRHGGQPRHAPGRELRGRADVRGVARLGRDAARDRQFGVKKFGQPLFYPDSRAPGRTGDARPADHPVIRACSTEFRRPELLQIVALTLRVTGCRAARWPRLVGVPLGALLGLVRFRGQRADHARALHRHGPAAGRRRPVRLHAALAQRAVRLARLAVHAGGDDRRRRRSSRSRWSPA